MRHTLLFAGVSCRGKDDQIPPGLYAAPDAPDAPDRGACLDGTVV